MSVSTAPTPVPGTTPPPASGMWLGALPENARRALAEADARLGAARGALLVVDAGRGRCVAFRP